MIARDIKKHQRGKRGEKEPRTPGVGALIRKHLGSVTGRTYVAAPTSTREVHMPTYLPTSLTSAGVCILPTMEVKKTAACIRSSGFCFNSQSSIWECPTLACGEINLDDLSR